MGTELNRTELALLDHLQTFLTPARLQRFEEVLKNRTRHITVVLENLHKPHNVSAIMRTCDCFGVQDLHVIDQEEFLESNEQIARGAQQWVTQTHWMDPETATVDCLSQLKHDGYQIVATTPHDANVTLYDMPVNQPMALVYGKERTGVTETVLEMADLRMSIPMYGFTESFNISVSVALTLSELVRRLHQSQTSWELSPHEKNALRLLWARHTIPNVDSIERRFLETWEALL